VLDEDANVAADSGHGGRTRDTDGHEADGWDEGDVVRLSISRRKPERRRQSSSLSTIRKRVSLLTM
jgi:hypothetical protein